VICLSLQLKQLFIADAFSDISKQYHSVCMCNMCVRVSRLDVTEGQFAVMFIYCLTAIFGAEIWDFEV